MRIDHRDVDTIEGSMRIGVLATLDTLHHVLTGLQEMDFSQASAATGKVLYDIAGLTADAAWRDAMNQAIDEDPHGATSDHAVAIYQDGLTDRLARLADTDFNGTPLPYLYTAFNTMVAAAHGKTVQEVNRHQEMEDDAIELCDRHGINFTLLSEDDPQTLVAYRRAMASEGGIETDSQGRFKVDPLRAVFIGIDPAHISPEAPSVRTAAWGLTTQAELDGERSEIPGAMLHDEDAAYLDPEANRSMGFVASKTGAPPKLHVVGLSSRAGLGEAIAEILAREFKQTPPRFGAGAAEQPSHHARG